MGRGEDCLGSGWIKFSAAGRVFVFEEAAEPSRWDIQLTEEIEIGNSQEYTILWLQIGVI